MEASAYYLNKLIRITIVLSTAWNLLLTLSLPLYTQFYRVSPEVLALVISTTVLHNIFTAFVSPLAQSLPNGFNIKKQEFPHPLQVAGILAKLC